MMFALQVYDFFRTRIEEQYPLDPTPEDPLEAQKTAHEVRIRLFYLKLIYTIRFVVYNCHLGVCDQVYTLLKTFFNIHHPIINKNCVAFKQLHTSEWQLYTTGHVVYSFSVSPWQTYCSHQTSFIYMTNLNIFYVHLNKRAFLPRSCLQFKRILIPNGSRKANLGAHKRIFLAFVTLVSNPSICFYVLVVSGYQISVCSRTG